MNTFAPEKDAASRYWEFFNEQFSAILRHFFRTLGLCDWRISIQREILHIVCSNVKKVTIDFSIASRKSFFI